jgi:hypothetical protein
VLAGLGHLRGLLRSDHQGVGSAMTPRRRAATRVSRLARAEAPVVRRATPAEALTKTPAEAAVAVAAKRAARVAAIPVDMAVDFERGKLGQTCPDCGITEAAGFSCTACDRRTGPAEWFLQVASPAKAAALADMWAKRRAAGNRGAALTSSASPGLLTGPAESLTLGF